MRVAKYWGNWRAGVESVSTMCRRWVNPDVASEEETRLQARLIGLLFSVPLLSALHLAATALPPDPRVAILPRREFFSWPIAEQLRLAAACQVSVIDARKAVYNFAGPMASRVQLATVKGWSSSFVLPDFAELGQALVLNGFLDSMPTWPTRNTADLDRELQRASRLHNEALLPVTDAMLALQPYFNAQIAEDTR